MSSLINSEKIRQGNRRTLAKAITLIESSKSSDRDAAQQLLQELLPHTGNSIRIGITGVPGVGKSTFINCFGQHLIDAGNKVAVLAVDPSSPIAGGSILGDKVRMENLSRDNGAFIRPSPSSGTLGGVAQKTRETMLLCEVAGFNIIIVETVGVGQSEYQVASMVDFFMVLMLPNAGDEIQGIKKGIIELADSLVINKADGDSLAMAKETANNYQNALSLLHQNDDWQPPVLSCSALNNEKIEPVWAMIQDYVAKQKASNQFEQRRHQQSSFWFDSLTKDLLEQKINNDEQLTALRVKLKSDIENGKTTAFTAASEWVELLLLK